MAVKNISLCIFTILILFNVIFAQEAEEDNGNKTRMSRSIPWLPKIAGCVFNAEPASTCVGCVAVRFCLPNNISITHNCGIFNPYCDEGQCSSSPSASCSSSGSELYEEVAISTYLRVFLLQI
ncbi:unnamed protein product [Leptidea sinapis]|uniref:Uncharacterized protein n=1 Tax=Leptidea sinapis TaxID=189913 RepID=A0A5E4Q1B6_9NEOP|nr:unnamed protein product [Leptidea sinapis]